MTYAPLSKWSTDDVWAYLSTHKPLWDKDHSELFKLYAKAIKENLKYVVSVANSELIQSLQHYMQTLQESVRNDDIDGYNRIVKKAEGNLLKSVIARHNEIGGDENKAESLYNFVLDILDKIPQAMNANGLPKSYIPYNRIHNIETSIIYAQHNTLATNIHEAYDLKKKI